MKDMDDFFDMVTRSFAFLVDQYGFQLTSGPGRSSLDSIRYEKKPLVIEFSWYKGEIDIIFSCRSRERGFPAVYFPHLRFE